MDRKNSKQYSVVFLVEGEKIKLRNWPSSLTSSFLCSAANSVGTSREFAAFGSGPVAKHNRASAFCSFCPRPKFLRRSEHIFSGKTPVCLSRSVACRGKEISS